MIRRFTIYFALIFMLAVMGCGDNSGDPTSRISLTVSPSEGVAPGGSAIITATVTKPGGTAAEAGGTGTVNAWGEKVTFKLLTANGAGLSTLLQKTDGNGIATTIYTAGNNYNQDVVQAVLENGMYASVVITKTGKPSGASIDVTAAPTSVKAYRYSVIKATVTDGGDTSKPRSGETVQFSLVQNNSGATLIVHNAVTDSTGQATATYQAGGNDPTQDVIEARLISNGATDSVIIDVTAGAGGAVISTMTASPNTVSVSGNSIIKVNVTDGGTSPLPIAGETVDIGFLVNNSGARLIVVSNVTDAQGNVTATYIAGATPSVTDVLQARVLSSGSTNSIIITVTP